MALRPFVSVLVAALLATLVSSPPAHAQGSGGVDPSLYAGLRWRNIGPFRGGRTAAVSGVAGDGRTFYSGAVGGGVWKTTNAGRTWRPVMDAQPVSSIGAIAVAPSDPNTVYVGSGEADMRSDIIHGNGMYRSTDGGETWARSGLDDSRQIGRILVDPSDPKTLLVAALGHAFAPNQTRGVYRSTDGGATWTRTLFKDANTGAIDLAADPAMHVVYASLWQTRRPPWNTYPPSNGPGSGLYKSTDGGRTFTALRGNGFASHDVGKIGLAVAPSDPNRLYAIVDAKDGGLYRSDDAGATWRLIDKDRRLFQRGWYFCHIAVDPTNADVVYVSDTSVYGSTDGGAHFAAIKGSPDGDDFHQMWIDPRDERHIALASDQGTSISIDGGKTWSSWFNQPTGQFYHVATDAQFPYRLYGAQQDSGAAMIVSQSSHVGIEARDWRPINAGGESGTIAPDPNDPNIVYGGVVDREDLRTGQTRSVSPTTGRAGVWRATWTLPLAFSPADRRSLYTAHQVVFRSDDGGKRWTAISPDLTRPRPALPATVDASTAADTAVPAARRGVVYALAPSPLEAQTLWAGTDDGLVHLTRDGGKHWSDVTPPGLTAWSKVASIEASHFTAGTAYLAVDRHRLDDDRPYVYATHDFGRSWKPIVTGIPYGSFVNVVREDPVRRGLLYAGTETAVYVSFDDGAAWQSLRLNMPFVSVRDISVRDGDLAIATHGRAFWILDDVEPLRALSLRQARDNEWSKNGGLFPLREAVRVRPGNDEAEASPPEIPLGENPPYGALIDYVVPAGARGTLRLTIRDAHGAEVRRWTSADAVKRTDPNSVDFPAYWLTPIVPPAADPGMHRFAWDFALGHPGGVLAPPGRYTVTLAVSGRTFTQPLVVVRDPRVHATDADLAAQTTLALEVDALRGRVSAAIDAADTARARPGADLARIDALAGTPPLEDPRNSVGVAETRFTTLRYYRRALAELLASIQSADSAPTHDERATWATLHAGAERTLRDWRAVASR